METCLCENSALVIKSCVFRKDEKQNSQFRTLSNMFAWTLNDKSLPWRLNRQTTVTQRNYKKLAVLAWEHHASDKKFLGLFLHVPGFRIMMKIARLRSSWVAKPCRKMVSHRSLHTSGLREFLETDWKTNLPSTKRMVQNICWIVDANRAWNIAWYEEIDAAVSHCSLQNYLWKFWRRNAPAISAAKWRWWLQFVAKKTLHYSSKETENLSQRSEINLQSVDNKKFGTWNPIFNEVKYKYSKLWLLCCCVVAFVGVVLMVFLSSQVHIPYFSLDKWFVQYISKCQLLL